MLNLTIENRAEEILSLKDQLVNVTRSVEVERKQNLESLAVIRQDYEEQLFTLKQTDDTRIAELTSELAESQRYAEE